MKLQSKKQLTVETHKSTKEKLNGWEWGSCQSPQFSGGRGIAVSTRQSWATQ